MVSSWRTVKLGDICRFKYGEMPKKTDLSDEGYPVFSGYRLVGRSTRYHYRESEIIVVARGVGGTGDIKMAPPFCFLTNLSIAILIETPDVYKPFLYYRLASTTLWELRTGSAQAQITIEHLKNYELTFPPLPVQQRIAGILSAYDELIENSQRRIKILESMARALYREWFVHFRFPGHENHPRVASPIGEIPQGWEVTKLGEVVELNYGKALKKENRRDGDYPVFGSSGIVGTHDAALVEGPGIIVGRKGNVGSVFWCDDDFFVIDTAYFVTSSLPLRFLFYVLPTLNFINSDAAVPGLSRNQAYTLELLVPPDSLLERFCELAGTFERQAATLQRQIQNLRRTRDLLMPRLLSGQIELKTA
jgi:type I restriction enzyme S subunit